MSKETINNSYEQTALPSHRHRCSRGRPSESRASWLKSRHNHHRTFLSELAEVVLYNLISLRILFKLFQVKTQQQNCKSIFVSDAFSARIRPKSSEKFWKGLAKTVKMAKPLEVHENVGRILIEKIIKIKNLELFF